MAREVSGNLRLQIGLQERNTAIGAGGEVGLVNIDELLEVVFAAGTADGQLDRVHRQPLSLTTTPTDIDLRGVLTSIIGAGTVDFIDLVLLLIVNTSSAGNIVVGGDANAVPIYGAANDTEAVPPGGFICKHWGNTGLGVTAGTGDILQLAASAGTVTGRLLLAGRSA